MSRTPGDYERYLEEEEKYWEEVYKARKDVYDQKLRDALDTLRAYIGTPLVRKIDNVYVYEELPASVRVALGNLRDVVQVELSRLNRLDPTWTGPRQDDTEYLPF